jgi:hypothetical protein
LDKNGCDVSLLYLNKEFKSDKDKESDSEYAGPVKKNYLRDMIKNGKRYLSIRQHNSDIYI